MNSHELYRITPTWCSHCEPHIGCVFSDLEILICWISQKLWKFYWIIVKKENKICIIKTEGTGLSTRNLGSTWKIMHPRTWTDLKSCKPLTCSLLEDLFCFVLFFRNSYLNQYPQWTILRRSCNCFSILLISIFPDALFNQMQHLRMNNWFVGLSEVLFTMGEK